MSATARARHAVEISMLGRSTISAAPLATIASLRADLASGDPARIREAAEALGLEDLLAAIRTDPAVQDAVLAALVEGGRLVEERRLGAGKCHCILMRPLHVRLVEPEWRTQ
jgi:hypothetical protein